MGSRGLFERARKVIPSGVNSPVRYYAPYPFFAASASGGSIRDADGRKYTDLCNGYGALLLGHGRGEVVRAVSAQLRRGTLFCVPTEQEVELARLISGNYPSMESTRLVNTGGEATMTAIRLARGFTKRDRIIKFDGCYHGAHGSVLVKAGSGSAHLGISTSEGVPRGLARQTTVIPYNDEAAFEGAAADDVAAVIVEPVMGNMGVIPPKKGFLRLLRKLSSRLGMQLIFDETITGFRLSAGGAQEAFGVRPDITTLAKALGGGLPIAAVGGKKNIMERLAPGGSVYEASTFAGNPVSVSAALASIRTINRIKGRLYPRLERAAAALASSIADDAADLGLDRQINRVASIFQVFFTAEPVTDAASAKRADAARFDKMFRALLKNGVFVAPSQFEMASLSAAHTVEDLRNVSAAYRTALGAAR
uniref:Glutamate-1-semialdehyde 2,1-aminomutase 1 n=1 Tax=Cenarchaeum symbiosum (strain A) TaxID=414004 RepID=GSA1_CENSY|nr:RecName: Full=Glutamate-1-semialdehyde 2,1-aminomutase 1; Short=GSA 1; AltName: Full=Glutamate-1-semialdehyde aminotransferase 1; Short=GSA-AT 1 [Cenarchaeum symbiosum A]